MSKGHTEPINASSYRNRNREFFWSLVNSQCSKCGYKKCESALQMHHINSTQKENIKDSLARWLSLSRYNLLKKLIATDFIILCSNCHIELHTIFNSGKVIELRSVAKDIFIEYLSETDPPQRVFSRKGTNP